MKSVTSYGVRFGCRWGQVHDFFTIKDTKTYKVEKCKICNIRKKYNKGYRMRIDNAQYVKDHVRNFAQETGPTKRVFYKIYKTSKCIIKI